METRRVPRGRGRGGEGRPPAPRPCVRRGDPGPGRGVTAGGDPRSPESGGAGRGHQGAAAPPRPTPRRPRLKLPRPAGPAAAARAGARSSAAMADELSDLLREFDEVMEDFDRGPACQYEQHLEELKKKAGHNVYDSGIDELESTSTSPGSSLNSSEEDLNTPANAYPSKEM
ncbi:regulator of cell cycle RGCC-like isoform X2 [Strix aluco]|uniref:regulator of cell cycle RGCC-like isoform X2 n=1 Tax=Strix aluco TaxID=111821 RepID=UPI003DA4AB18